MMSVWTAAVRPVSVTYNFFLLPFLFLLRKSLTFLFNSCCTANYTMVNYHADVVKTTSSEEKKNAVHSSFEPEEQVQSHLLLERIPN